MPRAPHDGRCDGTRPSTRHRQIDMTRNIAKAAYGLIAVATACMVQAATPVQPAIAFPDGYRQWVHVKSGLIDDPAHPAYASFGGIHHIYANAAAMQGYRGASTFPDGSVLVYDLLELRKQADGTTDQGPRRHVDVMVKDAKRFAATGGWGYEEFFPADPEAATLTPQAQAGCAACHTANAPHDHVFSDFRE
jgi:hypothetical protein